MGLFSFFVDSVKGGSQASNKRIYAEVNKNIPHKKDLADTNINNLVVYSPRNMQEVLLLIDCIKNNETCIVDLSSHLENDREKILNFLSGAVVALNGNLSRLQGELFIITPQNINIATL